MAKYCICIHGTTWYSDGYCITCQLPTDELVPAKYRFRSLPKLSTNASERKQAPVTTGVIDYFPNAIMELARLSKAGNDQHNPGEPLHWAREKSTDHADCIVRHLMERGTKDTDGMLHSAKCAWRAMALLQIELEEGLK